MDMESFWEGYPILATALGGDFHDFGDGDDAERARGVRKNLALEPRVRFFSDLIVESQRALEKMDVLWPAIANDTNRCLYNEQEAREWLSRMLAVWKCELDRMKRG